MPAASAPMPKNIVCRRENDPAAGRMHFAKSKGRPIRGGLCLSKSLAEFAARRPRIEFNSFFAAACTSRKILCAERVCPNGLKAHSDARVGAKTLLSKKGAALFGQA